MSDFYVVDDGALHFGAQPAQPVMPVVSAAAYWQARLAEAWKHYRTSPACRAHLLQRACIWRKPWNT